MPFHFGPFDLDEAGRQLRLAGREIPLQPRIFDLLVYLVHNRERVVSKDELLDELWPEVTVTEGSLQRAISVLRAGLREGGLGDAVRSFPRVGYRFCFEPGHSLSSAGPSHEGPAGPLAAARLAIIEENWAEAAALFQEGDALAPLDGGDLSSWAIALICLGKPSDAIPVLIRAETAHAAAGNIEGAGAAAIDLAMIHCERNESAVAKGWISRAEDMLAGHPEKHATGRLYWMKSRIAAFEGEPNSAAEFAEKALELGRLLGDVEIQALGLMYRGFYKLCLGDTKSGLADQDHAAVLSLSRRVPPITGSILYCNILWACRSFGDWARANQWTLGFQDFCRSSSHGVFR